MLLACKVFESLRRFCPLPPPPLFLSRALSSLTTLFWRQRIWSEVRMAVPKRVYSVVYLAEVCLQHLQKQPPREGFRPISHESPLNFRRGCRDILQLVEKAKVLCSFTNLLLQRLTSCIAPARLPAHRGSSRRICGKPLPKHPANCSTKQEKPLVLRL